MSELRRAIVASAEGALQRPDAETALRSYCFAEDFPGFAGHFPGYPIVPAIVQLLLAQVVAEEFAGGKLDLESVANAKFLLQLRPRQTISVEVRQRGTTAGPSFEARLTVDDQTASAFVLNFTQGGEG